MSNEHAKPNLDEFQTFLQDKFVYLRNVKFYQDFFKRRLGMYGVEWVTTRFANGQDFMDGNPIFSLYVPETRRALRIIQTERNLSSSFFHCWVTRNALGQEGVTELAISLQLRDDAISDLAFLVELFLSGSLQPAELEFLNEKYKRIRNQELLSELTPHLMSIKSINKGLDETGLGGIPSLPRVKKAITKLDNVLMLVSFEDVSARGELYSALKGFQHAFTDFYETLTVKYRLIHEKILDSREMDMAIVSTYRSTHNYRRSFQSRKNHLMREVDKLLHIIQ